MNDRTVVVLFVDGTKKNFKDVESYWHDLAHECFFIEAKTDSTVMLPDSNVKVIGFKEDVDND